MGEGWGEGRAGHSVLPDRPSPPAPALRPSPSQSSGRLSGRSDTSLFPLKPRKRERGDKQRIDIGDSSCSTISAPPSPPWR
ncbi:hypothetical protein C7A17_12205 [Ectopseudomonas mendocina]|uniref:Uncharacterized protein n=1 Tax=Ectopseudomonas mendocina TaxID=300 RepID=A0A2R3QNY1_ECTME|nr:hypothetical protein C7A17_12205 [Pseudomonas mendocina]